MGAVVKAHWAATTAPLTKTTKEDTMGKTKKATPMTGTFPDGTTWAEQNLFEPLPPVAPRKQPRSRRDTAAKKEREKVESRRRIEAMQAEGYCVSLDGSYCGWKDGQAPDCKRVTKERRGA